MTPARWWEPQGDHLVCRLCPLECLLGDGQQGTCGVRVAHGGALYSTAYGQLAVAAPAPIERKFLYHVRPGAATFSFAAGGCNLSCRYCQNWLVSQAPKAGRGPAAEFVAPDELVQRAAAAGCGTIAATYSEPGVWLEYALDVAVAARQAGLAVVWKTNGCLQPEPQAAILPCLLAVNVDLKAFDPAVHQQLTGAPLEPVLAALRRYHEAGVWVEVTTLVIPTLTDSADHLRRTADWLLRHLGPDVPWHLNRFHPDHALRHLPPTPREALLAARQAAREAGLRYVYSDATATGEGWDTSCARCGEPLITRAQYRMRQSIVQDGGCPRCGERLPGRFGE
ncbi:MAG: AmmeMemoRadiSam system radical SAM enzyme [Fimbriimonadaceae bacterium]|nr:AmmeMemoRadiSam system radical SAM enzyme [Fimbriimonadaceae bacterium]